MGTYFPYYDFTVAQAAEGTAELAGSEEKLLSELDEPEAPAQDTATTA